MALPDKLGEMAQFANEVQAVLDREVELLEFTKGPNGQAAVSAVRRSGAAIQPHPQSVAAVSQGGWFFCQIVKEGDKAFAKPIAPFQPDLYFEARPVERLYVEQAFEREQKHFETEVAGDVIQWTPITRMVTVNPDGRVELGEFAPHFPDHLAFANIGKAKGEAAPLLGVAPATSKNAYKIEGEKLLVPRLDRVLGLTAPAEFAAEWNDERKILIVYLEGVSPKVKL